MNTTASLTFPDAAAGTGRVKSSIFSAIKSCRWNGSWDEFGHLRVEAAELHREIAETRTRAAVAEQRVADLTAMLDDMREQRDRWHAQAHRLSSALTDQPNLVERQPPGLSIFDSRTQGEGYPFHRSAGEVSSFVAHG